MNRMELKDLDPIPNYNAYISIPLVYCANVMANKLLAVCIVG
jgi:hypothetical protein